MTAPTVHQPIQIARPNLLRRLLRADAALCALSGATAVALSGQLAALIGVGAPTAFMALGVVLLAYAGWLLAVAAQERISRRSVWFNIILGSVWVVDSAALLIGGWLPLTPVGTWLVAGLADVVALLVIAQFVALRRERGR